MKFVLRRLFVSVPMLFLVIAAAFFLIHAAPGSPFVSERGLTPEVRRSLEHTYGLDQSIAVQFGRYVSGLLRGDLGPSLKYRGRSVLDLIEDGLPVSVAVGVTALLLGLLVGTALGLIGALHRHGGMDHGLMIFGVAALCVPTFVTAPLLVLIFASHLGWLPAAGLAAGWRSYVLPVLVLSLPQVAIIARLVRAGMLEVLDSSYVRTARSRALPEHRVILHHALPAAILPVVAYLGPASAGVLTGSLVVEKIFGLPGVGRYFVISALQRDYTVLMGVVILYAAAILTFNLASDLLQRWLDPRVRLA
jgi:oligopeptide transport system permease protein